MQSVSKGMKFKSCFQGKYHQFVVCWICQESGKGYCDSPPKQTKFILYVFFFFSFFFFFFLFFFFLYDVLLWVVDNLHVYFYFILVNNLSTDKKCRLPNSTYRKTPIFWRSLFWRHWRSGPSCSKHQLNELVKTNTLTVVAKAFSNTVIFLLQKCE